MVGSLRVPGATVTHMASNVGIRELRQNLSKYVAKVKDGEEFVVTERGQEVARLIPSGIPDDPVLRLAREHGASIPVGDLNEYLDRVGPIPSPGPGVLDAILAEQRADRL